jgi:hypothetical protein
MKKIYEEVNIEAIAFSAEDIVTLSENQKDDTGNDIFGPNN